MDSDQTDQLKQDLNDQNQSQQQEINKNEGEDMNQIFQNTDQLKLNYIQTNQIQEFRKINIPQKLRGIIYSYFTLSELIQKACKISKEERDFLADTNLIDWTPSQEKLSKIRYSFEHIFYMRRLQLNINSKLKPNPERPDEKTIIDHDKLEYLIRLSQVIIFNIDYWTLSDMETLNYAKFALEKCMFLSKKIELIVNIEKKIDVNRLVDILGQNSQIQPKIEAIEIIIGKFEYENSDDEEPGEGQANNPQQADENDQNLDAQNPIQEEQIQIQEDQNINENNQQNQQNDEDEFHSAESSGATESDSDTVNTSDGYSEDERNYYDKVSLIITSFQEIKRLRLTKHEQYVGHLFLDYEEKEEADRFSEKLGKDCSYNSSIEYLFFDTSIIENFEIELLCKVFPNLKLIVIAAENVLETKINLKNLKNLELISLFVIPSQTFSGEIHDEVTEEDLKFELQLEQSQIQNIQKFNLHTDDFHGQDLVYLLEKIGCVLEFKKILVYVGCIMINEKQIKLKNEFYIEDLYKSLNGISVNPKFNQLFFKDGKIVYDLQRFSKNKQYNKYPIEICYQRPLNQNTISNLEISNEQLQNQNVISYQDFKIYAETCEIQLLF